MSLEWTHALTFWPSPFGWIWGLVCSERRPSLLMEKVHSMDELHGTQWKQLNILWKSWSFPPIILIVTKASSFVSDKCSGQRNSLRAKLQSQWSWSLLSSSLCKDGLPHFPCFQWSLLSWLSLTSLSLQSSCDYLPFYNGKTSGKVIHSVKS